MNPICLTLTAFHPTDRLTFKNEGNSLPHLKKIAAAWPLVNPGYQPWGTHTLLERSGLGWFADGLLLNQATRKADVRQCRGAAAVTKDELIGGAAINQALIFVSSAKVGAGERPNSGASMQ